MTRIDRPAPPATLRPFLLLALLAVAIARSATADAPAPGTESSDRATSHRSFEDVAHWLAVFESPDRERWQKPAEVVAALDLQGGMTVADLGAGTGYFLPLLSGAVGPAGTVLAVEPEPNLVVHIRKRAEEEKLANVVPILASFDNPRLPAASVDLILIVDTYHHIDERRSYLSALTRFLRPGGRVAIVDWEKKPTEEGPPLDHRLSRQQVLQEMLASGYRLSAAPGILPYQYFLVFEAGRRISPGNDGSGTD